MTMIKGKRQYDEAFKSSDDPNKVDYFNSHFTWTLEQSVAKKLAQPGSFSERMEIDLPGYDIAVFECCADASFDVDIRKRLDIHNFGINEKLLKNFEHSNSGEMNDAQLSLYNVLAKYIDLTIYNDQIDATVLYCLHTVDHVIRTRNMVIGNNQYLRMLREKGEVSEQAIEKTRDQGLSRAKVLMLCPMKKDAFRIIELFRQLIFGTSEKPFVTNYHRFKEEFGDTGFRISEKRNVSEDYRHLINGNNDDCFRIGVSIAKKSLRLYTPFDESDIVIASPLGLRMIVGEQSDQKRDIDFLASIEILIIDKTNILLMQNWEHLLHLLDSVNLRPVNLNVDISRVRQWSIDQLSNFYRQTILISPIEMAECDALNAIKCANYAGRLVIRSSKIGSMRDLEVGVAQEIQRITADLPENQSDARFAYFKEYLLQKCDSGTLIFIPSYFDFVRVRNFLKNDNESFVQLHEYAKKGKVAKARALFLCKQRRLMLLTERFHFFRRYNIKGIKSILFYQLPTHASFYAELVNMISDDVERAHIRILFTQYDHVRMINVFGDDFGYKLLSSPKATQLIIGK